MRSYWSCTKFVDWLRGTPKIRAGTTEEWNAWKKAARTKNVRYWLAEDGLNALQNFVNWPKNRIQDTCHYIDNRWISRTHALTSTLKRGQWYEFETRLLHSAFDALVNSVEVEQAWLHVICSEEEQKKYKIPIYRRLFRMHLWRCPEAGLAYLEWAASLTHDEDLCDKEDPRFGQPTTQALAARETLVLYRWWKEVRPKRSEPMDASGLSEYYEKKHETAEAQGDSFLFDLNRDESDEDKQHYCQMSNLCHKIEQEQEEEDTDMLVRLVKVRQNLWT
jgi:hypothetical protein